MTGFTLPSIVKTVNALGDHGNPMGLELTINFDDRAASSFAVFLLYKRILLQYSYENHHLERKWYPRRC